MAIVIDRRFVAINEQDETEFGFGMDEETALVDLLFRRKQRQENQTEIQPEKQQMPEQEAPKTPKHVPDLDKPSKNWALKAQILKFISEHEGVHSSKIFEKFGQPCRFVLRQLRDNDLIVSQAISHGNRAGFHYFTREHGKNIADANRSSIEPALNHETATLVREKIEAKCLDEWHAAITQVRTGLDNDGEVSFDWDHMRKDWFEDYDDYKEFALAFEKQKIPAKIIGYDYTAKIDNAGSVLTITSIGKNSEAEKHE